MNAKISVCASRLFDVKSLLIFINETQVGCYTVVKISLIYIASYQNVILLFVCTKLHTFPSLSSEKFLCFLNMSLIFSTISYYMCSCGSVVNHCVSSAKVVGSIPREHTY